MAFPTLISSMPRTVIPSNGRTCSARCAGNHLDRVPVQRLEDNHGLVGHDFAQLGYTAGQGRADPRIPSYPRQSFYLQPTVGAISPGTPRTAVR